jgi:nitrogen regulatory protein PII
MNENAKLPILQLLVFIIDWNKIKVISTVFEEENVRFHFISKGRGTANSEILDLLGIGSSEKAVIFSIEQAIMVPPLIRMVRKKLGSQAAGAGIAFTIPLSGINNPILKVFKESIIKNQSISSVQEGEKMNTEIKHDLIVSIVNQGYSDEFMTVAREAGAGGGTVINARGLAHKGPVKFFGVSVQDEKEIIIIIASRERQAAIMQAVSQAYGITTEAGGIIFSLPVDHVMSLNQEEFR